MKTINNFLPLAKILVKKLSEQINLDVIDLKKTKEKIVIFINKIEHFLLKNVIDKIKEPIMENQVFINGKKAYYRNMQNLRFKNRFGEEINYSRRSY